MALYTWNSIAPTTETGTQLATRLDSWQAAVVSSHSNATEPTYKVTGTVWYDTTLGVFKVYTGSAWLTIQTATVASPTFVNTNEATAANIHAGAADVIITPASVELAAVEVAISAAVDWSTFINGTLAMTSNQTLGAPTNWEAGTTRIIRATQGGAGSFTLGYNTVYKFPGGTAPILSTAVNATDTLYIYCVSGTEFHVTHQLDFS